MNRALLSILKIYISSLLLAILGRILFLIVQFSQSSELGFGTILEAFFRGAMLDLSVAGYITALPMLLAIFGGWFGWSIPDKIWRIGMRFYLLLIAIMSAAITAVDANLYRYWGYKIDATLLPYLTTPTEAAASLNAGDVAIGTALFLVMLTAAIALYRWATKEIGFSQLTLRGAMIWTPTMILLAGVMFIGIRGGVGKAVANVSKVYFSPKQFANHVAVNPLFSLLSSIQRIENYAELYPFYPHEELVERFTEIHPSQSSEPLPILNTSRPNIAIIIGESYTRAIMDMEVEGKPVMPNLTRIAAEGLDFTNTIATGGRTDRGVAAVLSGFPAQPKLSVMKIPAKSRNLPSLARSLGREGYSSHFYYGGELNFMDMSSYLYSTGWGELIQMGDISSPEEAPRQWGYSDGVTMKLFGDEIIRLSKARDDGEGAPLLASLLTLSSHEPFDVPEEFGIENRRINSMAYTDAKLGLLIDQLQGSEAWDDLLVVIVADHVSSFSAEQSYNAPVRFHIPFVLTGGALAKRGTEEEFISQYDIAATLLSQMGIDHGDYLFSRDFYAQGVGRPRFGYFTFSDGFGVVDSNGVSIFDNRAKSYGRASGYSNSVETITPERPMSDHESRQIEWGKSILQMTHQAIEEL